MRQTSGDKQQRSGTLPARRFERRRRVADERHRAAQERLADARRRALVSAWLRSLSRGG
jgi:hypothetical protein